MGEVEADDRGSGDFKEEKVGEKRAEEKHIPRQQELGKARLDQAFVSGRRSSPKGRARNLQLQDDS